MSDQKENFSQEEKLASWRLERDNRRRHESRTTAHKPLTRSSSRRPVLHPHPHLKSCDRKILHNTPMQQSTPLQNLSNGSKSTPFSYQSSSAVSKGSGGRPRVAGFMQPTTSSSKKTTIIQRPRKSLVPSRRLSTTMGSARRKSGGFLSQPAQRVTQQTPSSVSSSFADLPDDNEYLAKEQGKHSPDEDGEPLTIHSIRLSSPRLPVTSPLPVFSPTASLERDSPTNGDSETSENNINSIENKGSGEVFESILEDKAVSGERDETPFTSRSRSKLEEDELPALNAALDEFTNLSISFNLDFSDDEDSFKRSRISRDRARVLGPILPIPSLRDDIENATKTPNQSTAPCDQDVKNASLQSARLSPLIVPTQSVALLNFMEEEEDLPYKPLRSSRSRSRDLGPLLPIPSLRDDSLDTKNDSSSEGDHNCSESPQDGKQSAAVVLPKEILENVMEMDKDLLTRPTRASRDQTRKFGPILPIPSLRDDPPDEKLSSTPDPDASEQTMQDSPFDSTVSSGHYLSNVESKAQYGNENLAKQSPVGEQVPLPEPLQLDISSPLEDDTSVRRRRRQSYTNLTPAVLKQDKESGNEPVVQESNGGAAETLGVAGRGLPQQIDSIPLVKFKDRHILTAVSEEPQNTSVVEALQEQLTQALIENRQQAEKLARYNRTYEERVTPFRTLFEDWREEKQKRRAAEAQNALVQEVQEKVANTLKLTFQRCQDLEAQLQASQQRVAELEREVQNDQQHQTRQNTTRKR